LRGKRNPSPILAKKIARCLGVEISDAFITQNSRKS
jgi:DNA-binding XRE family transcriptional regulator